MNKAKKILGILLAVLLLAAGVILYIDHRNRSNMDNGPYDPGTPAPDPHDGTFVSDHGTMTFNGDGKTVVIDFSEELSSRTGLPSGKQEGTYVFLSGDLPPHGSYEVRYDVAHELEITVGDTRVVLDLAIASEDGKTASFGVDTVTPERIPLGFKGESGYFTVLFEKQ